MKTKGSLSVLLLLGLLLTTPLHASSPYETIDASYFVNFDTGPFLVDPGSVEAGPDGTVAVWDEGLQQYFYLAGNDTSTADTTSTDTDTPEPTDTPEANNYRLNKLLDEYHQSRVVREWGLSTPATEFFSSDGRFWSYVPRRSTRTETAVIHSHFPTRSQLKLPGPIQSIVTSEDQWLIQLTGGDTPLIRWDPYSDEGLVDTAPYRLEGDLIGVTPDGRYITRRDNQVRTYRQGEEVESRTFSSIKDITVQTNSVYVLTGNQEVTRLDTRLTAQYTFFLPRNRSYHSLAIHEDTIYLTSPQGLFSGVLDETGRSFFSQSTRLTLRQRAERFPVEDSYSPGHRLWLEENDTSTRLLVKSDTTMVRSLEYRSGTFTRRPNRSIDDLARTAFQYFQVDATYWRGEGNLYYFFKDDSSVEQYDTQGRLVKRRSFSFDQFDTLRDLQFLGADSDNVYFTAKLIDSRRGFQQFVLRYDWQGNLSRRFRLQHPFSGKDYMAPTEGGTWRYLGGENFYQLHSNSIVVFDRQGYPRQTITNVSNPVDVARNNGTLFVLDLRGRRMRAFEEPRHPTRRFGLPSNLRIGDLTEPADARAIFSGSTRDDERLELYEYDLDTYDYQEVLSHPKQTLRYPLLADNGDSLFFWGQDPSTDKWTLYNSDTVKYSARPLKRTQAPRGNGFYSTERQMLFYPISPKSDTGAQYSYTNPFGDTEAPLKNSQDLKRLQPGGFTGFYGVKKTDDTYSIVSGYLERQPETGPLHFMVADTLYRTQSPINRLMPGSNNLYFSRRPGEGLSQLGRLSTPSTYSSNFSSGRDVDVEWLGGFRGYITDFTATDNRYYLNLRTRETVGRLYHFYPESPPASGGLQGRLTSSNPRELSGISLRVDPGGQLTESERGGQFSFSDVPTGYLELNPTTYRNHFSYSVDLPVRANEYTVNQSIPMAEQEELLLLERGLKAFDRGRWNNARVPIEAFRELTQDGPYYRWSDAYVETIYREAGDTAALVSLFERRPELFSARELLSLYESTSDPEDRRTILRTFRGALDPYFRRMIRNEISLLQTKNKPRRRSLNRPILSQENKTLPRLIQPIRKSFPE